MLSNNYSLFSKLNAAKICFHNKRSLIVAKRAQFSTGVVAHYCIGGNNKVRQPV